MSAPQGYCHAEAYLDDEINVMGDWDATQLLILELYDDTNEIEPAWAALSASQARQLGFRLLELSELGDHRARGEAPR